MCRERVLDPLALLFDLADLTESGQHVSENGRSHERLHLLREIAEPSALGEGDLTEVRGFLARKDAKEGRLPRPVRPDEADAHTGSDGPGEVLEDRLRTEPLRECANVEHGIGGERRPSRAARGPRSRCPRA